MHLPGEPLQLEPLRSSCGAAGPPPADPRSPPHPPLALAFGVLPLCWSAPSLCAELSWEAIFQDTPFPAEFHGVCLGSWEMSTFVISGESTSSADRWSQLGPSSSPLHRLARLESDPSLCPVQSGRCRSCSTGGSPEAAPGWLGVSRGTHLPSAGRGGSGYSTLKHPVTYPFWVFTTSFVLILFLVLCFN